MDNQIKIKVVSLKNLWDILIHRLWIIALIAVLTTVSVFTVDALTFEPRYNSTATMYILRQNATNPGNVPPVTNSDDVAADFSLALNVVKDCTYLIKSHTVLAQVTESLSVDVPPYEELSKQIEANNPENTRILEVTVTADTPHEAKLLVDKICTIGADTINKTMGFEQINLYEYGTYNLTPCNKTKPIIYIFIGILAAILVYSVFLIIYLLDATIRTDEDIETYLGLSILGDIPEANQNKKKKYRYHQKYSYGYQSPQVNEKKGE